MQTCNICVESNKQVKRINDNEVTKCGDIVRLTDLFHIFKFNIVKFLLDDKDAVICNNCIQQLEKCYEFVQQIQKSETKLKRMKKIKTEHDYFGRIGAELENEITNEKVILHSEMIKKQSLLSHTTNVTVNLKPILPKSSTKLCNIEVKKILSAKSRVYKCLQCADVFKSHKHLNEHEKNLCKNKFVKYLKVCSFCHKCYSKEESLGEHVSLEHSEGQFLCCLCQDKQFRAKGYLSRHIEKVHQHESLKYFCGLCTDIQCLSSQEELREHFLESHALDNINDQQKSNFNDEDMELEMHEEFLDEFLLAHTNENSFQFSECWETLDLHLTDMLQETASNINNSQDFTQAFSCPKCYEQFKTPQTLLNHLADIHDLSVLICRVCCECFASYKDFRRHKLQTCVKNSKFHSITLECPYCGKKFENGANLKQHIRVVHCQIKKHICQLCDKQFSTLDHLKKHVLSQHQNERKHLCTICDKKFTQLGHLKQHLAIHTTGKTIQCTFCYLKFWRKIDLERHRLKYHNSNISEK